MDSKSSHILTTASNLLGFSFLVITSIKALNVPQVALIDEIVSILITLLALSCIFSFSSLRTKRVNFGKKMELIADYLFLISLVMVAVTALLISVDIIEFT